MRKSWYPHAVPPTAEMLGRHPIIPWREPESWKKSWRGIELDKHWIDDGPEVA